MPSLLGGVLKGDICAPVAATGSGVKRPGIGTVCEICNGFAGTLGFSVLFTGGGGGRVGDVERGVEVTFNGMVC